MPYYENQRIPGDSRGSRSFPSWSWIGWNAAVDWPSAKPLAIPLEFRMVDDYHIWAIPVHGADDLWRPLGRLDTPSPLPQVAANDYIIHMQAWVFKVHLRPAGGGGTFSVEVCVDRQTALPTASLACASKDYMKQMSSKEIYEVVLFIDHPLESEGGEHDARGLLVDTVDGHDLRIGTWHGDYETTLKARPHSYLRHVKLR